MPIKTFRGQIADGDQDTIVLHTSDGSTGYRIIKLALFPTKPGGTNHIENVVQIWKEEQTTVPTLNPSVDFSDNRLLAAAYLVDDVNMASGPLEVVIFDTEIFNQDIYVTHTETTTGVGLAVNYYIELEQIKLDLNENTVATLKDIRNVTGPT
jgi:hypothetical protein